MATAKLTISLYLILHLLEAWTCGHCQPLHEPEGCRPTVSCFPVVIVFVFVFVIFFVMSCLLITLNKCLKCHKSLGLLLGGVLKMSLSLSLSLSLYLSLSIFVGHVMSSHHSEKMSQRSQVSRMAL